MATEPKIASFARFRPSMATSNEERTPSHPFDRWDLSSVVEPQSNCKRTVLRAGCEEESEP